MEPDIQTRLRALRHLAGFSSVEALAQAIDAGGYARNLGAKTIRLIEQGARTADTKDLYAIAETCKVPLAWFTADFSRLAEISDEPRGVIARETAAAAERSRARQQGTSEANDAPPREDRAS